jgi:hypothetical protein
MLLGSAAPSEQLALGEFGEPLSVGDAVFQLLAMLARKATSPQLILRPLFDFLSSGKLFSKSAWLEIAFVILAKTFI